MLPQKKRLTKQKDFDNVYKNSKSAFGIILSLRCAKNDLQHTRIAVVVSNKISKKAVERNIIKRRIRAAISKIFEKMDTGYDCIFIAKPEILGRNFKDIEIVVHKLLKKQNVLK